MSLFLTQLGINYLGAHVSCFLVHGPIDTFHILPRYMQANSFTFRSLALVT